MKKSNNYIEHDSLSYFVILFISKISPIEGNVAIRNKTCPKSNLQIMY